MAIGIVVATVPLNLRGQATGDTAHAIVDTTSPPPAARAADVDSVGAILRAAYDAISGPAGPRDWQRFRSLFAPGGRLIPAGCDTAGHCRMRVISFNQYATNAAPFMLKQPFYEKEIGRKVDTFGSVAQVFSSYASRHDPSDAQPFARGINSFQLFYDGTRWYIVTIYWNAERKGLKIPAEYLNESE